MVARIHHRKEGVEYVLQYDSRTDSIKLRINRYTLIGGIPNYFRHEWGTYVREMDFFKRTVLNHRPFYGLRPHPYPRPPLSDAEKDALHEFEKIAGVNLLLTPESISRHRMSAMAETAQLPGIDTTSTVSFLSRIAREAGIPRQENEDETDLQRRHELNMATETAYLADLPGLDRTSIVSYQDVLSRYLRSPQDANDVDASPPDSPPPTDSPPIPQEAPTLRNTEGLTEEQIQETEVFVARLLNGETLSARENPPLPNPNTDASTPDPNTTEINDFLKELDAVLEDTAHESDEVWGAPTHYPEISAESMQSLWKQAREEDSDQ